MSNAKTLLKTLVKFPTATSDHAANQQALDFTAAFLQERGMHVERFELNGFGSLVATTHGVKTPNVMLAGHLDVVPAPADFFNLREVDGKFFGRGVLDMKFAIASYLDLVDKLQDRLAAYDFGIMLTTDEEIGGQNGVAMLLERGYRPTVCVLPDGGDNWQIQTHSKGFLYLTLSNYGKPAHGSRPWQGENAIEALMQAIHDLQDFFKTPNPSDSNTLNVGMIKGGKAINQVADYAEASLDVRTMSEQEKHELLQEIRGACDRHGVEVTVNLSGTTGSFSLEDPYIAPFAQLITEVTGVTVSGSRTLGSSDARFFAEYDIPCISLYPPGGGHHSPQEWLDVEGFEQFQEILSRYIEATARIEKREAQHKVLTPAQ